MQYKCFVIFLESRLVLVVLSSLKVVKASNVAIDKGLAMSHFNQTIGV